MGTRHEDLFENNKQEPNFEQVHSWLNVARATMLENDDMMKDAIEIRQGDKEYRRFPFEELRIFSDTGETEHTFNIHARTDLA